MARRFRFRWWQKKRGARRTGSPLLGTVGEAVFFGLLFLLGAASLAALIVSQVTNPDPEMLQFGFGFWLMILVLGSFLLIGGGGVLYAVFQFGTSAERRSALARRAANIELISEAILTPRDYPSVPSDSNLTNSPGIRFAFRLPTEQSPLWQVSAAAIFGLLWNGLAVVLAVVAVNRHLQQRPDWLLTLLVFPFLLVGVWSLKHFLRQMFLLTVMGPTIVEIGRHPLRPGESCEVFVSQSGHVTFRSLELKLTCTEEATYHQGTDVRVDQSRVYEATVFKRERIAIEPGKPFEHTDEFFVPPNAMHSLHSPHNRVLWSLVVAGEPEGWPAFERSFPLVVYPAPAPHATTDVPVSARVLPQPHQVGVT